jgi:hypothetical protein
VGCQIVPIGGKSTDSRKKKFSGTVQKVERTYGEIRMDELDLEVVFVPNPKTNVENPERETFTREDIGAKVEFNLMFAYSGLRAFNPVKAEELS